MGASVFRMAYESASMLFAGIDGGIVPERLLETYYRNVGRACVYEAMASALAADSDVPQARLDRLVDNAAYFRRCAAAVALDIMTLIDESA